jgi:metal-responsive CopG/Arc/MetJ family transcriptional regulator
MGMRTAKIAITIEKDLLTRLDRLVKSKVFPNWSEAVQDAVEEKLARIDHRRLVQECAKLDPKFEQSLAEEGFTEEVNAWPKY